MRRRKLEPNRLAFYASRVFKPIQTFRRDDKQLLSRIYDHSELHHPRFVGFFLRNCSFSMNFVIFIMFSFRSILVFVKVNRMI